MTSHMVVFPNDGLIIHHSLTFTLMTLRYESCSPVYFPTIAMRTGVVTSSTQLANRSQLAMSGGDVNRVKPSCRWKMLCRFCSRASKRSERAERAKKCWRRQLQLQLQYSYSFSFSYRHSYSSTVTITVTVTVTGTANSYSYSFFRWKPVRLLGLLWCEPSRRRPLGAI